MPSLRQIILSVLAASTLTNVASAGHLRRYAHYTQRLTDLSTTKIHIDGLDAISDLICAPCSTNTRRQAPGLDIPATDLSTMYKELQALKAEAINRMVAEGLTPTKRTVVPFLRLKDTSPISVERVGIEKRDLDHLIEYVCPPCPLAKRQTRVTVSVSTNIRIQGIPPNQLQSVLDRINAILKQIEEALRRFGIPIPEGSFPTLPPPSPAPAPEQPSPQPEQPAPAPAPEPEQPPQEEPQPNPEPAPAPAPAPEQPPQDPGPAPEPAPNPEPTTDPAPAPTPTTTSRSTTTNRITISTRISFVTTVTVRPDLPTTSVATTTPSPPSSSPSAPEPTTTPPPTTDGPSEECPETVTVNSTTTVFE